MTDFSTVVLVLSYLVVMLASVLMAMKVWHFIDIKRDWRIVKETSSTSDAIYLTARGAMREAWLRVIEGVLWMIFVSVALVSANTPATPDQLRIGSRVLMLLMISMEMAKIVTDRLTRYEVQRRLGQDHEKGVTDLGES